MTSTVAMESVLDGIMVAPWSLSYDSDKSLSMCLCEYVCVFILYMYISVLLCSNDYVVY